MLASTVGAWPISADAQQATLPVVGYLGSESPALYASRVASFLDGLKSTGFVDGRNVVIEYRWAEGRNDRLAELAADLVRRKVNVIATPGSVASTLAAKAATSAIPIVFEMGADPVGLGVVASLSNPGGNITGVTSFNAEVGPKRLELLHELLPAATTFALLVNPSNPANAGATTRALQAAAAKLGLRLHVLHAATESELEPALAEVARLGAGGLVIANETYFAARSDKLARLAQQLRVPAAHQSPEFTRSGGPLSYGGDVGESHWQAGHYTGRVLKGEAPATLPVQQARKVNLTINLKAAKSLGLTVPPAILARADEVVE